MVLRLRPDSGRDGVNRRAANVFLVASRLVPGLDRDAVLSVPPEEPLQQLTGGWELTNQKIKILL
jgi:hypothetical protein